MKTRNIPMDMAALLSGSKRPQVFMSHVARNGNGKAKYPIPVRISKHFRARVEHVAILSGTDLTTIARAALLATVPKMAKAYKEGRLTPAPGVNFRNKPRNTGPRRAGCGDGTGRFWVPAATIQRKGHWRKVRTGARA